jgi:LPXTG-site transpeptidase (sortase) family protein
MMGMAISKITLAIVVLFLSAVFGEPSVAEKDISPDTLEISSLMISVPIIFGAEEPDFQKALEQGVVHYPGTALPGEYGNAYIFGHSSDNAWSKGEYKTIFIDLPDIEIGAEIILNNFVYIVQETKLVESYDLSVLNQDYSRKILTLQTSYPVGTSDKRFIVIAALEE